MDKARQSCLEAFKPGAVASAKVFACPHADIIAQAARLVLAAGGTAAESRCASRIMEQQPAASISGSWHYEPPIVGVDKRAHQLPPDHREQLQALIAQDRRSDAIQFFIREVIGGEKSPEVLRKAVLAVFQASPRRSAACCQARATTSR